MVRIGTDVSTRLQKDPSCIRNICILAHVDHGKTSLSDSLLASNGIISQRLAGRVRYLDSRPDEQLRGITMESSAISLYFRVLRKQEGKDEPLVNEHLINLIDSPGHIDFSSEVSAASRLCDGAVVLVDVVEGVCSQTVTVLRQCWMDKLRPVLVLNKIDRLISELRLTPLEAYQHLNKIIEQVNSVLGSFFAGERMLDDLSWREKQERGDESEFVEKDDNDIYFDPAKNNVIFGSAIDGWGFNVGQFAKFYEAKLGFKRENLQKVLWGDFYLDPKTKKIINSKGLKGRNLKPLFVSLVLDNIWKIYENLILEQNMDIVEKITNALNIKLMPRDLKSKDTKNLLRTIMGQWIPVSTAVLLTVVEKLPSPLESQKERIPSILETAPGSAMLDGELEDSMMACDNEGPVSVYVSKMLSIPEEEIPKHIEPTSQEAILERARRAREMAAKASRQSEKRTEDDIYARVQETVVAETEVAISNETVSTFVPAAPNDPYGMFEYEEEEPEFNFVNAEEDDNKEVLIGFARIYSGTLRVGQEVSVLGPKYDPAFPNEHVETATITSLYLLMGKELVPLEECPSGNIVGIGGLGGKVLKNGTIVEKDYQGVNLAGLTLHSQPIVRVALEPVNPSQMHQLERGLKLLNQADPCVQVFLEDSGEHILATAGELHLERCLKDLRERFAGIEITSSEPVIPYRETFLKTSDMNPPKNAIRGQYQYSIGDLKVTLRAIPLPYEAVDFIIQYQDTIKSLSETRMQEESEDEDGDHLDEDLDDNAVTGTLILDAEVFKRKLQELLDPAIFDVEKIAAFGAKRTGPNILFSNGELRNFFDSSKKASFMFDDNIVNGFQLSVNEGPLCKEQVQGMAVFLDSVEKLDEPAMANISGRLITTFRDGVHQAFLDWSPRIMLAMYTCEVQTSAEVLGKVYAVVQQRRGRIISEEMKEGTPFFQIEARIPVVDAFGFSEDIRKKTSGAAQPQLVFAGFEAIDLDPFWVPTTEQELEDLGEFAERENIARKYMNQVRKRKGLFVDEKVVQNAEKQRTLKRN